MKGLRQMAFEKPKDFSSIVPASSLDQSDGYIVNQSQDATCRADRHASGIFPKSHIQAIVQTSFHQPMFASRLEYSHRRGMFSGKAGDTEFDLTAGFVASALPEPDKLALETVDLSNPGLVKVIIQQGTGLDGAFFKPSMAIIGLFGRLEIGLDLAKARFRLVRCIHSAEKAGIPAVKGNLVLTGVLSTESVQGRGGAWHRAFDLDTPQVPMAWADVSG